MTLEEAKDVIDRMISARPTCDRCTTVGYIAACGAYSCAHGWCQTVDHREVSKWMLEQHNFDEAADFAGYLRRCSTCATSKKFPWAEKLDPVLVQRMVDTDPRCAVTFELKILEETLEKR